MEPLLTPLFKPTPAEAEDLAALNLLWHYFDEEAEDDIVDQMWNAYYAGEGEDPGEIMDYVLFAPWLEEEHPDLFEKYDVDFVGHIRLKKSRGEITCNLCVCREVPPG